MNELLPDGMRAVAIPWFKGRVYVECAKSIVPIAIVRLCVSSVETAYVHRRIERVPDDDGEVLKQSLNGNTDKLIRLQSGSWARLRRGKFMGDIVRVRRAEDDSDVVEFEVVPRLWERTRKRGRGKTRTERAPQVLFSRELTEGWTGFDGKRLQPGEERGSWTIDNEEHYLSNGLRCMKVTGLHLLKHCKPNAKELELFTLAGIDTVRETNREFVRVRDEVTVMKGNLRGIEGRVTTMKEDVLQIKVAGKGDSGETVYDVNMEEVRRVFRQGDHVQVCIGKNLGRRGIVIEVGETDVTVVDFSNKQQVR